MALTPFEFATKWQGSAGTERAASQEHFIDLCRLVGAKTPNQAMAKVKPIAEGRRLRAYLATGRYRDELADARWVA